MQTSALQRRDKSMRVNIIHHMYTENNYYKMTMFEVFEQFQKNVELEGR